MLWGHWLGQDCSPQQLDWVKIRHCAAGSGSARGVVHNNSIRAPPHHPVDPENRVSTSLRRRTKGSAPIQKYAEQWNWENWKHTSDKFDPRPKAIEK